MKKEPEIDRYSAKSLQIYGSSLGGEHGGCQDYTHNIPLVGVRIVDAEWLEGLVAQRDQQLAAIASLKQELRAIRRSE